MNDLKGIIILGMLLIVNVPNPIIKTEVFKIYVINPIRKDFTVYIIKS